MKSFNEWQQTKCARLGVTVEEHDKILEMAWRLDDAFGGGGAYDYITAGIYTPGRLAELADKIDLNTGK